MLAFASTHMQMRIKRGRVKKARRQSTAVTREADTSQSVNVSGVNERCVSHEFCPQRGNLTHKDERHGRGAESCQATSRRQRSGG